MSGPNINQPGNKAINPFCDSYAKTAVSQHQENLNRNCGYSDRRWQSSYDNHYGWCVTVSRASAESETKARAETLQTCKPAARRK